MFKSALILPLVVALAISTNGRVNLCLEETLATKGTANIIVQMAAGTEELLNKLNQINFVDRAARLNSVANSLKSHAAKSQDKVLNFLSSEGLAFHSLWISNKIFIANANSAIVTKLATFPDITEIHEEHIAPLTISEQSKVSNPFAQPNIEAIQAHFVWSELQNNGTGAIVASIDTGVRYTHEALINQWVGDSYGWYDPIYGTRYPEDTNGKGTHTMGIMVGGFDIGVAPGAKWMSCWGCTSSCTQSNLERCAQFILCPTFFDETNPDCSRAPHVVNNAWEGGQGDTWFDSNIAAWKTAGIIPIFANGNSGANCGNVAYPADSIAGVIAVGATNPGESIWYPSSRGPSVTGLIKPDISAPGYFVRSADRFADDNYNTYSGTTPASAHVSGVIALMVAENKNLPYTNVAKFLFDNTDRNIQHTGLNCGGVSEGLFPNNAFGWGRLNAFKAVRAVRNSMKA